VQVQLRGDPDNADEHVAALERAVGSIAASHPGAELLQAGEGSGGHAVNQVVDQDLSHAELVSLPITLIILIVAFGALVAAVVPLLLGLTSVAGAIGALGLISHIAPEGQPTTSVVVLIGLAVGVDYSLFYIRREREERRAGRSGDAALTAATASVGRAIVVAALTVTVAAPPPSLPRHPRHLAASGHARHRAPGGLAAGDRGRARGAVGPRAEHAHR
jgi:uncharacterized membrane protein YdfJ with MMPL/SSD domain